MPVGMESKKIFLIKYTCKCIYTEEMRQRNLSLPLVGKKKVKTTTVTPVPLE